MAIMLFAYLDEFGHIGPFKHRQDPQYKDSPVFGLAGIILPEPSIRPFATKFLQLKEHAFADDIKRAGKHGYDWEKKGCDIFKPKALKQYPRLRQIGYRLLTILKEADGKVFYYGREKVAGRVDGNANGLHTTVFSHAIRRLDAHAQAAKSNFAMVVDQHSARAELLECAAKTMFGVPPARKLVSPPFEVESHLNQNIQAADWIAAIIGRMGAYQCLPDQFQDHKNCDDYFASRIAQVAVRSTIERRRPPRPRKALEEQLAADGPMAEALKTLRFSINDNG